jgi:YggT family protein
LFNLDFGRPLCAIGNLYLIILIARAIFSWFPLSPGSPFIPIVRFLHTVTEPLLAPMRRIIPAVGMIDISFVIVFFVFELVILPILCRI